MWAVRVCAICVVAFTAACSRYPIVQVAETERAHQKALEAEAPLYSPVEYQRYQDLMTSARALLAEQQARWLFRKYGPAVKLLEEARLIARSAEEKSIAERAMRGAEVEDELRQYQEALTMIRDGSAGMSQVALLRSRLSKAELSLATADSYWQVGDYDAARRTLMAEAETVRFLQEFQGALEERNTNPELLSTWNRSVRSTIEQSAQAGAYAIIVNKYQRTLTLYRAGRRIGDFPADLGANPFSEKRHRGDKATPEGLYHVVRKLDVGQSDYYKALVIDYPNERDWERYRQLRQSLVSPPGVGGNIEIHGRGGRNENWTAGCVAVNDQVMDRLFTVASVGTPVTIVANETVQGLRDPSQ